MSDDSTDSGLAFGEADGGRDDGRTKCVRMTMIIGTSGPRPVSCWPE